MEEAYIDTLTCAPGNLGIVRFAMILSSGPIVIVVVDVVLFVQMTQEGGLLVDRTANHFFFFCRRQGCMFTT